MRLFWALYAAVAVLTAARAAYGMYRVRGVILSSFRPDAAGIAYVAMFIMSLAMGICWFLYWPALGAVVLLRLLEEDEENDGDR